MDYARFIEVEIDGEVLLALEIPAEVLRKMGLVHGEVLSVEYQPDSKSIILKSTNTVYTDNGE